MANSTQEPVDDFAAFRDTTLASIIVAEKYLYDAPHSNKTWAAVSGLSLTNINTIEIEFLKWIEYQLMVSERDWRKWLSMLRQLQPVVYAAFCPTK